MKQISFKTLQNGLAQLPKRVLSRVTTSSSVGTISAILLLSACGQRGPLYHPEPPPPTPASVSNSTPEAPQKSTKQ